MKSYFSPLVDDISLNHIMCVCFIFVHYNSVHKSVSVPCANHDRVLKGSLLTPHSIKCAAPAMVT